MDTDTKYKVTDFEHGQIEEHAETVHSRLE